MKQEPNRDEKCCTNTDNQLYNTVEYFLSGPSYDSDKKKVTELIQQLQRDFEDIFYGIGCFDGTFLLQLKPDSKPYQVPLRCMAYTIQKPFQEELKGYKNRT